MNFDNSGHTTASNPLHIKHNNNNVSNVYGYIALTSSILGIVGSRKALPITMIQKVPGPVCTSCTELMPLVLLV